MMYVLFGGVSGRTTGSRLVAARWRMVEPSRPVISYIYLIRGASDIAGGAILDARTARLTGLICHAEWHAKIY